MSIRVKFRAVSNEGGRVELVPVTAGSPENETFYYLTPSGVLIFQTINPAVATQILVGAEYYIDITAAEFNQGPF